MLHAPQWYLATILTLTALGQTSTAENSSETAESNYQDCEQEQESPTQTDGLEDWGIWCGVEAYLSAITEGDPTAAGPDSRYIPSDGRFGRGDTEFFDPAGNLNPNDESTPDSTEPPTTVAAANDTGSSSGGDSSGSSSGGDSSGSSSGGDSSGSSSGGDSSGSSSGGDSSGSSSGGDSSGSSSGGDSSGSSSGGDSSGSSSGGDSSGSSSGGDSSGSSSGGDSSGSSSGGDSSGSSSGGDSSGSSSGGDSSGSSSGGDSSGSSSGGDSSGSSSGGDSSGSSSGGDSSGSSSGGSPPIALPIPLPSFEPDGTPINTADNPAPDGVSNEGGIVGYAVNYTTGKDGNKGDNGYLGVYGIKINGDEGSPDDSGDEKLSYTQMNGNRDSGPLQDSFDESLQGENINYQENHIVAHHNKQGSGDDGNFNGKSVEETITDVDGKALLVMYWNGSISNEASEDEKPLHVNSMFVAGVPTPLSDMNMLFNRDVSANYQGHSLRLKQQVNINVNFGSRTFSGSFDGNKKMGQQNMNFGVSGVVSGQHIIGTSFTGGVSGAKMQGTFYGSQAGALGGGYEITKGSVTHGDVFGATRGAFSQNAAP